VDYPTPRPARSRVPANDGGSDDGAIRTPLASSTDIRLYARRECAPPSDRKFENGMEFWNQKARGGFSGAGSMVVTMAIRY